MSQSVMKKETSGEVREKLGSYVNAVRQTASDVTGSARELAAVQWQRAQQRPVFYGALAAGSVLAVVGVASRIFRAKKPSPMAVAAFIDKCTARWFFERTAIELYEEILTKCPANLVYQFEQIRDEEKNHEEMLEDLICRYGADPHLLSESARITQMECEGIINVVCGEGYNASLDALLAAELLDNAKWDLLKKLAREIGDRQAEELFATALDKEAEHLAFVRKQVVASTLDRLTERDVG